MKLEHHKLPPTYFRKERECYLDPIRKKLIYITSEETVRQRMVSTLIKEHQVPMNMLAVEEKLSHYGVDSKRRSDIVIHGYDKERNLKIPIAVIECKAPGVLIGDKAHEQVVHYANKLQCDYIMLTDGNNDFCSKYDEVSNTYLRIKELPKYQEMLQGNYTAYDIGEVPPRTSFENLKEMVSEYKVYDIGRDTSVEKSIPLVNLWECMLDVSKKLPAKEYKIFKLIEDYGLRSLSCGNAAGGDFSGIYRSFLIEVNGNTEIVSLGISPYITTAKPNYYRTIISIAIDNEKTAHHSLQLVVDENMIVLNDKCSFYHHGRIGIGNIGSGKISELREFVRNRYPKIIDDRKFYLGSLAHDRLWYLDDAEVIELIENLISYAIIRDEYREHVKAQKK